MRDEEKLHPNPLVALVQLRDGATSVKLHPNAFVALQQLKRLRDR